jgi:hypothetical protein
MRQESAFEHDAVSRVGARGLMQLMPATASFIANKIRSPTTERPWRPEPRPAAPPSDFGGRVRERRAFLRSRHSAEDRRDVDAGLPEACYGGVS